MANCMDCGGTECICGMRAELTRLRAALDEAEKQRDESDRWASDMGRVIGERDSALSLLREWRSGEINNPDYFSKRIDALLGGTDE